ncbi:MAG: hypothetical protein A2271_01470 [Candidatus Moranbacteria bacterium RIFOXYA12_FULL_35_19]|nr:MAG: hypothetical protein UR78_C0012G0036 [Candidatus Moranbacteria bacterium GW2011_GWF2_35_39]OGI31700.1 MAG: hypothetical protein A2343_02085 [Candidatus Moranbacteria bacterium RIFOXYB12_FULL_35_8]OGI32922.1 MAG: hypothetical protein A2489_00710 [Candidatus Moranbacteria bacterium RIFOXYC12_FULL_36_13]OGI35957.1 MAG: hypothetical protein A2271_01470 [Candidatus Moranbacteria bacterium RIFOXYA12_FULL_35_19]
MQYENGKEKIQLIQDLNELNSPVFSLGNAQIRQILFRAGIIKTQFQHDSIGYIYFGYVEKIKPCPANEIKQAKKVIEKGRTFYVLFQESSIGPMDGVCTVYRD